MPHDRPERVELNERNERAARDRHGSAGWDERLSGRTDRWSVAGDRSAEIGERRTIVIRGQVADRNRPATRRRPARSVQERALASPDRMALWAVMLGLLLIVVAATTAHP